MTELFPADSASEVYLPEVPHAPAYPAKIERVRDWLRRGNKVEVLETLDAGLIELAAMPKAKQARARNVFGDWLAKACGINPLLMTAFAARTCVTKALEIIKVTPAATEEDFRGVVEVYRRKYPSMPVTPSAINANWAELYPSVRAKREPAKVWEGPAGWREYLRGKYPEAQIDYTKGPWDRLPRYLKEEITSRP